MYSSRNIESSEPIEPKFSYIRCAIALVLLLLLSLLIPVLYLIGIFIPFYDPQRLGRVYHALACRILGVDVKVTGQCTDHSPCLFLSNHVSYLDICSLGKIVPGHFVAKSEVAGWPVLNKLARLQKTVFIDRQPGKAKQHIAQLRQHFEKGENLILFPEGTTTDGAEIISFKSSLFAAADSEKVDIYIQTVSLVYGQYEGVGMNQNMRDNFAWYADMPLGSHFLKVAGLGKVSVHMSFSKPVLLKDFPSRKDCANHCESMVRESFERSFKDSGSVV